MRRARWTTLAAIAALSLAACAPVDDGPGDTMEATDVRLTTVKDGVLTIATSDPAYQPWVIDNDPTSGEGFESAVAYAVAESLGYPKDKVTWSRVPFNAAIQPGPKTYDINLTEFSITEERRNAVDFSTPYYDVKQAVVTLGTSPAANAAGLAELRNAKLGAQVGTTSYQAIVDQTVESSFLKRYGTIDEQVAPILFLASDEASYITGVTLPVAGGDLG